jgi:hypothetical protein
MAIPLIELISSPLILVPLLVLVVIEALVMGRIGWQQGRAAFADAALANVISFGVTILFGPLLLQIGNDVLLLLAALFLAVPIEGAVLMMRRRRPAAAAFLAALVTNVASFVFVIVYALSLLPL